MVDFFWCMMAAQRGWSIEEIANKLLEVSAKAQERARLRDEGYALITTQNAAAAATRGRQAGGQGVAILVVAIPSAVAILRREHQRQLNGGFMPAAQAAVVTSTAETRQSGNPPVDKIRIGNITAAIFENSGQNGTFYSVKLGRSYKDDETWKNTDSLGRDDLLIAAKALDKAHDRIIELQQRGGGNQPPPSLG
jgi:hypothetical protein